MPVTCSYCQKNYSEKVVRCPFCNTAGTHAPPPVAPQPAMTPAAMAAAQDPEVKKRMVLAAIQAGEQLRTDPQSEFSHSPGFSLQNIPTGTKAAIVMWMMAALSLVIGFIIILIPAGEMGKDALQFKIMGIAGFIGGLVMAGLGFGAFRNMIICVWIGAAIYFVDFVFMITHRAVGGAMIKLMILIALLKFGWQMKEEQE